MQVSNKCPKCNNKTDKFILIGGVNMACDCSKCSKNHIPMTKYHEWTTDEIKEGRIKYKNELYQPYRGGEFSKEFKEANPEVSRGMVKEGAITQKQYNKAKNVWGRDVL